MTKKAIVLLSGGVDSVCSLYWAIDQKYEPILLSFNYKSRPEQEKEVTRYFASLTKSQLIEVDVPFIRSVYDLVKDNFPVDFKGILDDGYIPAKNLIFYSIASYYAEALGAEFIIGGHIASDEKVFPDASESYFNELNGFIEKSLVSLSKPAPKIINPLINLTKEEVGHLAKRLGAPLDKTWSCYKNGGKQCGKCESCLERLKAINAV